MDHSQDLPRQTPNLGVVANHAPSPAQKLATARQLRETAWQLVAAGVRLREPGLSDAEVADRVRRIFLRAVS